MGHDDHRLFQAALRQQFSIFTRKTFGVLNPVTPLSWNWHLEAICYALDQVRRGEVKRLIITLPPRSLKSTIASVAFPAYLLGHNPSAKLICLSYASDLSFDFARKCRALMNSQFYRDLFPGTMISSERDSVADFVTTQRGHRISTSVGGTLTGRGGDVVIVDDFHKPDEALSDARRNTALQWFDNTLYSRLDDKNTGAIVIVMQRLHLFDLVGHVLEKGDWTVLNLPAVAEDDQDIPIGPGQVHHRQAGDLLHPERESLPVLDELRRSLGSNAFSAQYQQRPVPLDGQIFRRSTFRFYRSLPGDQLTRTVQSWDTAQSGSPNADYSVCTTWKVYGQNYYLVDLVRKRLTYPELKRTVIEQAAKHKPNYVVVEDIGAGQSLNQDLIKERPPYCANPSLVKPRADKLTRAAQHSATFEAGMVHFPMDAPWLDDLLLELMQFPGSRNDDQVDSISQFLNWQIHNHVEYAMNIKVNWPM
jgi:predicted phage terminase large subunit-like protein